MSNRLLTRAWLPLFAFAGLLTADDGQTLLRLDHYVPVRSTAPSMAGQTAQLYVREVLLGNALRRSPAPDRVVLFVHGAGTPAEVAFDVPYQDYSWMAYLAREGFDVFAMDLTGYGRSTRPPAMNDPCNLSADQQKTIVPSVISAPCQPTDKVGTTNVGSDWHDIGAVVDYLRARRGVDKVALIGWSRGGPRAGGYAAQHPDKVSNLILLSPDYNRSRSSEPPAQRPTSASFNLQSHSDLLANWTRQIGCPDQFVPAVADAVWSAMLESDPVGATWGNGVRRAPDGPVWGFNSAIVGKMQVPTLIIAPVHDKQTPPERARELHADLGSPKKVMVDLACSSHNALWEKNHLLLFRASLEWLTKGTVNGSAQGIVQVGY